MKINPFFTVALLTAAYVTPQGAQATVLAFDNFDYANGDLTDNAAWAGYGSAQNGPLQVESGQAVIQHDGSGVQDVVLSFTGTSGILFYAFDFSIDDLGAPVVNDGSPDFEYSATFYNSVGGDNLSARFDVVAPSEGGDFSIGIASDDGTADATWGSDLIFGESYRVVVSYDQDDNLAQLWLDPTLSTDTSILGTNQTTDGDTVSGFALRQATSDNGEILRVDNLVIGDSFESVVATVPEPSSAVLFALGLVGFVSRRNRR